MKLRNYLFIIALTLAGGLMLLQPVPARADPSVGRLAPNVSFTTSGKSMSLAIYRGQKVMLWMFSTWCPSCQVGLAALARKQAVLRANDVHLVVLENYRNGGYPGPSMTQLTARRAGAVKSAPNWTFGMATRELASAYNAKAYPDIYYLIGTDGKVKYIGSAPASSMQKIVSFARK